MRGMWIVLAMVLAQSSIGFALTLEQLAGQYTGAAPGMGIELDFTAEGLSFSIDRSMRTVDDTPDSRTYGMEVNTPSPRLELALGEQTVVSSNLGFGGCASYVVGTAAIAGERLTITKTTHGTTQWRLWCDAPLAEAIRGNVIRTSTMSLYFNADANLVVEEGQDVRVYRRK